MEDRAATSASTSSTWCSCTARRRPCTPPTPCSTHWTRWWQSSGSPPTASAWKPATRRCHRIRRTVARRRDAGSGGVALGHPAAGRDLGDSRCAQRGPGADERRCVGSAAAARPRSRLGCGAVRPAHPASGAPPLVTSLGIERPRAGQRSRHAVVEVARSGARALPDRLPSQPLEAGDDEHNRRTGGHQAWADSRYSSAPSASSSWAVPCSRRVGSSWPSRKAPCSVRTSRVQVPSGVSSSVETETESRSSSRCMS